VFLELNQRFATISSLRSVSMKRTIAIMSFAFTVVALSASTDTAAKDKEKPKSGMEGVQGTVFIIDGNKNKDSKVTLQEHDTVVMEFTYPISPPFPKGASQKSSDPEVVKGIGVHRLVQVKGPLGVGRLGAIFVAEKKGKATLTFDVQHGDGVKITCEVDVK
jgi:hypothetical protein